MVSLATLRGANKVVMFSWVTCPYCNRAEKLLQPMTTDLKIHYVDKMGEGEALREEIRKLYQHETVPAIFINGEFVGGCSDVEALDREGKLSAMLGK
ncbi:glutaredoxin [Trypanosoma grayi]|uniref:glutaredoxin n=1 Tax=Trypanosoma grayi TaxID=71804 RepID=UPI0004F44047|nr:glutaredoxin [Trypanosoma grayi]KEG13597.1 glutaredoxin [Trypanosoma grayi]